MRMEMRQRFLSWTFNRTRPFCGSLRGLQRRRLASSSSSRIWARRSTGSFALTNFGRYLLQYLTECRVCASSASYAKNGLERFSRIRRAARFSRACGSLGCRHGRHPRSSSATPHAP